MAIETINCSRYKNECSLKHREFDCSGEIYHNNDPIFDAFYCNSDKGSFQCEITSQLNMQFKILKSLEGKIDES